MPDRFHDDPTVPPPGKRSGTGVGSIFPFLEQSLATKVQDRSQPEDASAVPDLEPDSPLRKLPGSLPHSGN